MTPGLPIGYGYRMATTEEAEHMNILYFCDICCADFPEDERIWHDIYTPKVEHGRPA